MRVVIVLLIYSGMGGVIYAQEKVLYDAMVGAGSQLGSVVEAGLQVGERCEQNPMPDEEIVRENRLLTQRHLRFKPGRDSLCFSNTNPQLPSETLGIFNHVAAENGLCTGMATLTAAAAENLRYENCNRSNGRIERGRRSSDTEVKDALRAMFYAYQNNCTRPDQKVTISGYCSLADLCRERPELVKKIALDLHVARTTRVGLSSLRTMLERHGSEESKTQNMGEIAQIMRRVREGHYPILYSYRGHYPGHITTVVGYEVETLAHRNLISLPAGRTLENTLRIKLRLADPDYPDRITDKFIYISSDFSEVITRNETFVHIPTARSSNCGFLEERRRERREFIPSSFSF